MEHLFPKVYSNGLSEIILGKAIKKFDLPRDEIVVMTKVRHFDPLASSVLVLNLVVNEHSFVELWLALMVTCFDPDQTVLPIMRDM